MKRVMARTRAEPNTLIYVLNDETVCVVVSVDSVSGDLCSHIAACYARPASSTFTIRTFAWWNVCDDMLTVINAQYVEAMHGTWTVCTGIVAA